MVPSIAILDVVKGKGEKFLGKISLRQTLQRNDSFFKIYQRLDS